MNFWLYLGLQLLAAYLQPKPKARGPEKYSLSDFSYPTADETRAMPLGFGTFKVAGNLIWFGDYAADKVRKKIRSFPTREYQDIGYKYKVGQWLTLCASTADELIEIRAGERTVWSGSQTLSKTAPTDVVVNAAWTTGEGQELSEGMQGTFRFFNHEADPSSSAYVPLVNSYMQARLGAGNVPAYPNLLHVVWLGPSDGGKGFCSISNNLEALTFVLRRKPNVSAALVSSQSITFPSAGSLADPAFRQSIKSWCDSKALIEGNANPELVKLEILTTKVPGVGPRLSGDAIELESVFRAADKAYAEGLGVSFAWEQTRPVNELLADLDQVLNGFTELNEKTGQIRTKLARSTDEPVYVFDSSNIIGITSWARPSSYTAPNEIVVPYVDRSMNWTQREQTAQNEAGIKAAGAINSKRIEYIGVSTPELASYLATRALASNSASAIKASWSAFIEVDGYMPKPGDLVALVHPEHGEKRMRIDSVRFAEFDDRLSVELEGVEDMFRSGTRALAYSVPTSSLGFSTGTTPQGSAGTQLVLRAPRGISQDIADHMLYAIAPGDSSQLSADIGWASVNSTTKPAELEYAASGQTYLLAVDATLANQLAFTDKTSIALNLTAPNAENLARLAGSFSGGIYAVIWSGGSGLDLSIRDHEIVMLSAAATNGSSTASVTVSARGLFDTWPRKWIAGSRIMILTSYALDPVPLLTNLTADAFTSGPTLVSASGEAFSRVWATYRNGSKTGYNSYGSVLLAASYEARAMRPATPANVKLNGSYGGLLASEAVSIPRTSPLTLTWVNRGTGASGGDWFSDYAEEIDSSTKLIYRVYRGSTGLTETSGWTQVGGGELSAEKKSLTISTTFNAGDYVRVVITCVRYVNGTAIWPATNPSELDSSGIFAGRHMYWKLT